MAQAPWALALLVRRLGCGHRAAGPGGPAALTEPMGLALARMLWYVASCGSLQASALYLPPGRLARRSCSIRCFAVTSTSLALQMALAASAGCDVRPWLPAAILLILARTFVIEVFPLLSKSGRVLI